MSIYYKILNEIAATFNMDQWDEQVNLFTDIIDKQLRPFVHYTKSDYIYILENSIHYFPQFNFYKERCYVNGEKVELDRYGRTNNKWEDQEIVDVIIEDLDQLGESCKNMFFDCFSLVSVPKFDTSRVTNMCYMFYRCWSLKTVPLFNIRGVTDMDDMFHGCSSLSEKTKQEWSPVYNFTINDKK